VKKLIILRKDGRSKEEVKSKGRETESVNSPNTSELQSHKMQRKKSIKNIFTIKRQLKILIRHAEFWENYVQIIKADNRIECVR
jgi:hypothetical protein